MIRLAYLALILLAGCFPVGGEDAGSHALDAGQQIQALPVVAVAAGHWRAEFTPAAELAMWTICAEPMTGVALWWVGASRQVMLAHSSTSCIGPLGDTPLRSGEIYRVVVIGSDEPLVTLSR